MRTANTQSSVRRPIVSFESLEALEDRRLCSATLSGAAIADRIRASASAAGVSDQVLVAAEKTASSGKQADVDKAERLILAAGLSLPPDAVASKLTNKDLVRQVAGLGTVGAGEKANDPEYWKTVRQLGANYALAGAIRESMVLPVNETKGKSPKQLLDDAAQISLMTGNPSSPKAWQGLALLKAGKISVQQFAQQFADGKDVVSQAKVVADQAALNTTVRNQINAQNAQKANAQKTNTQPTNNPKVDTSIDKNFANAVADTQRTQNSSTNSQASNGYNPQTDVATDQNYGNDGAAYSQPTDETDEAPAGTDPNGAEFTIDSKTVNGDGTTTVAWSM
ncbi:MAG TPA: hypothetical protein VH475_08715, partial [Tepidisphaeraceae bacterium]